MGKFIIKIIIFPILAFTGVLLDDFLEDRNIDLAYAIYFALGWIGCLIL